METTIGGPSLTAAAQSLASEEPPAVRAPQAAPEPPAPQPWQVSGAVPDTLAWARRSEGRSRIEIETRRMKNACLTLLALVMLGMHFLDF